MENKEKNVFFSNVKYHLLFSTRYLRKIFIREEIRERLVEIINETCLEKGFHLLNIECYENYIYLYLSVPSDVSALSAVSIVKHTTSSKLRKEFPDFTHTNALWNRSYCVSTTRKFNESLIHDYLDHQKKYK